MSKKLNLDADFKSAADLDAVKFCIDQATVIDGATQFYARQAEIYQGTIHKGQAFLWRNKNLQDVYILPEEICDLLNGHAKLPVQRTHMQYPKEGFDMARIGVGVLKITKYGGRAAGFMQAEMVRDLLQKLKAATSEDHTAKDQLKLEL